MPVVVVVDAAFVVVEVCVVDCFAVVVFVVVIFVVVVFLVVVSTGASAGTEPSGSIPPTRTPSA